MQTHRGNSRQRARYRGFRPQIRSLADKRVDGEVAPIPDLPSDDDERPIPAVHGWSPTIRVGPLLMPPKSAMLENTGSEANFG